MNIDFHSHIIPKIDDGSSSLQMSFEMLAELKNQGVDVVVATPHFLPMRMSVATFLDKRNSAAKGLVTVDSPKILLGAEVAYAFEIEKLKGLESLCIEGTKTLLLEMPMRKWSMEEVNAISSIIFDRNLDVVIAHLDRYYALQSKDVLHYLFKLPIYVQINTASLCTIMGKKHTIKLLDLGKGQVIGSDAHNMSTRPPRIYEGREVIRKKLGQTKLNEIDETAKEILNL